MFKLTWKVMLALVVVLVATSLFAASASQDKPAMKTAVQPDLSLKTVLSPELSLPGAGVGINAFLRTCRCSCGYPCKTDADCGPGGVCASGITCCATGRDNKDATAKIFAERESLSSRQTPSPIPAGVNCKQK